MLRVGCLCLFLLVLHGGLIAQIKFDVNVSDKHLKKVENSDDARSKLKTYKEVYRKDSIKAARRAWKDYKKNNKDSLKAEGRWKEARAHKKELLLGKYRLKKPTKYIVDYAAFGEPVDSTDWAIQQLSKNEDYVQVQKIYEAYGQYDSAYLDEFKADIMKLDSSTLLNRFDTKKRLESYLPPEMVEESNYKIAQQMKYGELNEYGKLMKIDRSGVSDFFKNISPEEFAKSQVALKQAKEKYSVIPDLSKEEEGIKRQSLKGSPLKDRLFLNGNVTIQSTSPVILDANIQLGYMWTKSFSTGIGLLLREQFSNRDSTTLTGDAHGISSFANYDIMKGFFIYGEYQLVKNKSLFQESPRKATWQYAALLGVGRRFQVSNKVSINVSLLYDFNYKKNTLNQRPLVPRIGYNITF